MLMLSNFVECNTVHEANMMDLKQYSFVAYSQSRDKYIFKIKVRGKKE